MTFRLTLLSLGSNIDPERNLIEALDRLDEAVRVVRVSCIYEGPAVGTAASGQPPQFLNAAVAIRTDLTPAELKFGVLRQLELQMGRRRTTDKNAPRQIDIDISAMEDMENSEPSIPLPDPEIGEHAYLALPLADVAPDFVVGPAGTTLAQVAEKFRSGSSNDLTRRSDLEWSPRKLRCNAGFVAAAMAAILAAGSSPLAAQDPPPPDAGEPVAESMVVDTVIVERANIFRDDGNFLTRLGNTLHPRTREYVVRRELLVGAGDLLDPALVAESERNLRALGLFTEVRVDTARVDGKLALTVTTEDAWTLAPRISGRVGADGSITGTIGVTEANVLGTGNSARLWFTRDPDRGGFELRATSHRVGSTGLSAFGVWHDLSDQNVYEWSVAKPLRSFSDRWSLSYHGGIFDGRLLRHRIEHPDSLQRSEYVASFTTHNLFGAYAPVASPRGYVRIGGGVQFRSQGIELDPTAGEDPPVPADTMYITPSAYIELRRGRYVRERRYNGFAEEDKDISDVLFLEGRLISTDLGYPRSGIGGRFAAYTGASAGPVLLRALFDANAIWVSDEAESGMAVDSASMQLSGTASVRSNQRNVTFAHASWGRKWNPDPAGEFDLGLTALPRLWDAHAFVGEQAFWLTMEHRYFAEDDFLGIMGAGIGAFVDYAGAWYDDQDRRSGGNVGISLFGGATVSSYPQVTAINIGYRFGGGIEDSEMGQFVWSIGGGVVF